jgi:hypothetical protein
MADACTIVKAQSQFAMPVTTRRVNLFRDKATISCAPVPALLLLLIEHSRCERPGISQDHENAPFTRSIAGCLRFFTLIQCGDRPPR